jgi:hypothetical protein
MFMGLIPRSSASAFLHAPSVGSPEGGTVLQSPLAGYLGGKKNKDTSELAPG